MKLWLTAICAMGSYEALAYSYTCYVVLCMLHRLGWWLWIKAFFQMRNYNRDYEQQSLLYYACYAIYQALMAKWLCFAELKGVPVELGDVIRTGVRALVVTKRILFPIRHLEIQCPMDVKSISSGP